MLVLALCIGSLLVQGSSYDPRPLAWTVVRSLDVQALTRGQHQSQVCEEECGPGGQPGMVPWWSTASHPQHGGSPSVCGSVTLRL